MLNIKKWQKKILKKKTGILLVIFLFLLLLSSGTFLWWQRQKKQLAQTPVASPSPSPSPTPTPSPSPSPTPSPSPSPVARPASTTWRLFRTGPFTKKIPDNASYTKEDRIGTVRPALEAYAVPIYRTSDENLPTVKVVNRYGGRTVHWPIPTGIQPSTGTDHTMAVIHYGKKSTYEMWNAEWQGDGSILAGGMKDFPFAGDGISHPSNQRVTASGFAGLAGALIQDDFGSSGKLNPSAVVPHALVVSLPHQLVKKDSYIPPAVGGEANNDNMGDIPVGTRLALPKNLDVESLDVHPLTKVVARMLRDYGAYVSDRNNAGQYKGKYIATFKIEIGLVQKLYGKPHNDLNPTVQQQMHDIIKKHGLYRVSQ